MSKTPTVKQLMHKFPYIFCAGVFLGTPQYKIEEELLLAEKENAPLTSMVARTPNGWMTIEEASDEVIGKLLDIQSEYKL